MFCYVKCLGKVSFGKLEDDSFSLWIFIDDIDDFRDCLLVVWVLSEGSLHFWYDVCRCLFIIKMGLFLIIKTFQQFSISNLMIIITFFNNKTINLFYQIKIQSINSI